MPARCRTGFLEAVPGPVSILVARETLALVQQAMGRLPLPLREAFLLRTQEELSYAEIAKIVETTEETVRWRVQGSPEHCCRN